MTQRRPLVAGNWKMNGTLASIKPLVQEILSGTENNQEVDIAVCVPYIYIQELKELLAGSGLMLGAQNMSEHESGAFTGEISGQMLRDYQCHFVILGHSERRHIYGETDEVVAEKFASAKSHGLIPIFCLGELLQEREAGTTEEVVSRQLDVVIDKVGIEAFSDAVIAYEPVWAIGTGHTATPEQAQEVHAFIRLQLARHDDQIADNIQLLYGGSVKADNAADLFGMADVDGGLIGGASLVASDFLAICQATR